MMKKYSFLFGAVMLILLNSCSVGSDEIKTHEERIESLQCDMEFTSKMPPGLCLSVTVI